MENKQIECYKYKKKNYYYEMDLILININDYLNLTIVIKTLELINRLKPNHLVVLWQIKYRLQYQEQ